MRILIAEDDPYSLKILRLILASEQRYEVVAVADGEAAWRELEENLGFNLCIFDLMMPGLDGLALTARMRADARFKHQRVMFCSALHDRDTIQQAKALGVSHYIMKPYKQEHVLRQVRHACEETAAAEIFEPLASVSARLGMGTSTVRRLLGELHDDVRAIEAELTAHRSPDAMRIHALKSAALNLGAKALALRLGQLEGVLHTSVDWSRVAPGIAAETERLRQHLGIELPPPAPAASETASTADAPAADAPATVGTDAPATVPATQE